MLKDAEEFQQLADELFEEFVGSDPNATFHRSSVQDPVAGTVLTTTSSIRAIKLDRTRQDGVTETIVYTLKAELNEDPRKDDKIKVDGKTYVIESVKLDPAEATWEMVVHVG